MPAASMSIARCGASCAASTNSAAPWRCAIVASSASGQTSPVTFDAPVTASRSKRSWRSAASQAPSRPASERANGSRVRSWRRQGSMFAWCSNGVERIRAPSGSAAARTLTASVVLRTKTTSSPARAPTKRATSVRASSNAAVATCDLYPLPRWTLLYHGRNASTAATTEASAGVLAALSRLT